MFSGTHTLIKKFGKCPLEIVRGISAPKVWLELTLQFPNKNTETMGKLLFLGLLPHLQNGGEGIALEESVSKLRWESQNLMRKRIIW